MTNFINLTPHAITVRAQVCTGEEFIARVATAIHTLEETVFPPSGTVARVAQSFVSVAAVGGIPAARAVFGAVEGLPTPEAGTVFIVSSMVLAALGAGRADVVAPDSGRGFRDDAGRIVAVPGFIVG